MKITTSFSWWRLLRLGVVWVALCGVLTAGYVLLGMVVTVVTPALSVALASGVLLFGLLLYGAPDTAVVRWHEAQLLSARELYATLFDQSPVPYLTLTTDNVVVTGNQAAARLLGVTPAALPGLALVSRFTHEDEGHLSVVLGKFATGTVLVDTELQLHTYTDEVRWVSVSLFLNETFGQRLLALVDITQHKVVDKAKSEFVALATHQLRTPVAAIRWNVELLERSLRSVATDKQTEYLRKVNRNVHRMLALINDFLSVSKLETGTFATSSEVIDLPTYLVTIVEEYEGQIKEKGINLTTGFAVQPYAFYTDTRLFHIITSNLLSNAVKYVRPGDSIQFGYVVDGQTLVVTVADSGIGIPAAQLPRLFSKFFRASNAMQHRAEGTGLGLYIVKEAVAQLGGTIAVQSAENLGTTFTVRLPLG